MAIPPPELHVRVRELEVSPGNLLDWVPEANGILTWLGAEQQIVGWGEALRVEVQGDHAIREASAQWNAIASAATVSNESSHAWADRAPFALASFGFAAKTPGFLIVPQVALVRRGDTTVLVTASARLEAEHPGIGTGSNTSANQRIEEFPELPEAADATIPHEVPNPAKMRTGPGRMTQSQWRRALNELIASLRVGAASKVVLTRDIVVHSDENIDERFLTKRLAQLYPSTWVFAVNGLIGATPEMLAALDAGTVTSRVLAGTAAPTEGADLFASMKNRSEHHFAVESVARALAPLADTLEVPSEPFLLQLPNVIHLATEVTATVPHANVLDIVDALHPTAAVCGTPTKFAFDLLEKLEGTERGRYSGPVGWIDGTGAGEFGIALRCGQLSENHREIRVFAGGGIMPDSIPDVELAETHAKMRPILDALGLDDADDTSLEGAAL
ncbi:isochorismate synthase [Actinomycetaceae bacterium L2_0104]